MNYIYFDLLEKNVIVYLDDILNITKMEEEHRRVLTEVFCHLGHYYIFIKEQKCACFFKQVDFLGHIVTDDGISVQNGKIKAVRDWPEPKTVTELQQFLGLFNYFRRCFLGYARIVAPFTNLLRGKSSYIWFGDAQTQAFQKLNTVQSRHKSIYKYTNLGTNKVQDPELPIRVQLDASKLTVGTILEQLHGSSWHPVEYFSKRLNDAESLYCATEQEILGCILALQYQCQYLIGKQFDVLTDHASNQYILSQQKFSRRQVRCVEVLAEYAVNFIYNLGRVHSEPDALSQIQTLNTAGKPQSLLEAVRQAQNTSIDQKLLGSKVK